METSVLNSTLGDEVVAGRGLRNQERAEGRAEPDGWVGTRRRWLVAPERPRISGHFPAPSTELALAGGMK